MKGVTMLETGEQSCWKQRSGMQVMSEAGEQPCWKQGSSHAGSKAAAMLETTKGSRHARNKQSAMLETRAVIIQGK
jgi:hypothetical protein